MGLQFVTKRFRKCTEVKHNNILIKKIEKTEKKETVENEAHVVDTEPVKNKAKKEKKDMISKEQIAAIENAVENLQPEVKVVKKDRGLIERTESSKIIITEDNRQVLND